MALAVLVVDRNAAVEQVGQLGRTERLDDLDRENVSTWFSRKRPSPSALAISASRASWRTGSGSFLDRLGAAYQLLERVVVEPPQDQYLAAREQGRIDLEARVLGRRADERDGAVLDIRQEAVLLGAVEAVDLVHEQQGLLSRLRRSPRLGENFLEVGDSGKDRGDGDEAQADGVGEQPRDAGLSGARRPPQDHGGEPARGDHPPDRALGTGQMLLPDDLVERLRAEPVGKRRALRRRFGRAAGNSSSANRSAIAREHKGDAGKCTSGLVQDATKIYLRRI